MGGLFDLTPFLPLFFRVHFADVKHAPVLVLDVDKDFEHDAAVQGVLMAQVGTVARLGGIPLPGARSESC